MKYAVGMIVSIRRTRRQLAGVIIGWQYRYREFESLKSCNLTLNEFSIEWYLVLCEDERLYHQSEGT